MSSVRGGRPQEPSASFISTTPAWRIDMEQRGLSEVIRASVHYDNTEH
jgi:hypothetical protein